MTKIDGFPKSNADWSARAKSNSYHTDKATLNHQLSGEGAAKDLKSSDQPCHVT